MKYYLPSVTSVTETYLIITRFLLAHVFSNYNTGKQHFLSYTFSKIMFILTAFLIKKNNKTKLWPEQKGILRWAQPLRYRWTPKYLPSTCPCGKRFDVDHAMSYMKGGFVHRTHDDVQDLYASLLKDVCHDVEVKPHLQPLTEVVISSATFSDEARLDVSARGFWQKGQLPFFDVRVFSPFAKSHLNQKLDTAFSSNEDEKKWHYNQRIIEVEHGSFSPFVFSPYGGNGREAERFLTELAQKLSDKKQQMDYSIVIHCWEKNYVLTYWDQ